jgi:hypothetical protein
LGAIDKTENLRSAMKRVVLTSSFAAIGYGAPKDRTAVFTEEGLDEP